MIRARGVAKSFSSRGGAMEALKPVELNVERGEFVSIIGPSGCGKSTFLRIVAGLETASSGSIEIDSAASQRAGFVFQDPVLLPWLSALENIRFPLDVAGVARAEAEATAQRLLELVGLKGFEKTLPRALSGGMRQRVSIARALSYDPPLLLMDEPFGALDLLTRDHLNDELLAIWTATTKTILFVTHSVEEAAYLSDRVVVMSPRPGSIRRIYQVPFSRPRGELTKLDPAFHQLMADLRRDLK